MHKQLFSILLIGALLLSGNALMAQRGHHGHHGPHSKHRPMFSFDDLMGMQTELELTDQQVNQLGELKTSFDQERESLKAKEFNSREEHREAFHGLMKEYKGKLDEVLTAEQLEKIETMKAERRARHKDRMENVDKEGLRKAMMDYKDTNIQPVMLKQRAKLEPKISAEDKAILAELRPVFEANRKAMEQLRKDPNHSREDVKAMRENHKEERERLKGLVEKYDEDIEALLAEVKGQAEQWHEDMREIHREYMPKPEEGQRKRGEGRRGSGEKHRQHDGHHGHKGKHAGERGMHKAHFLLLDPNAPAEGPALAAVTENVRVYPNPAASNMTLEYSLLKAGSVRIELRDKDGTLVRIVEESQKVAGDYTLPIDASSLQDGIYYLTIISQGQQTAEKVVVSRQ